ncbi:hypothetical protein L7F22_017158 [Adiantum nelumboides]|nr:hypothetical protein [Adiantum nelumboides]
MLCSPTTTPPADPCLALPLTTLGILKIFKTEECNDGWAQTHTTGRQASSSPGSVHCSSSGDSKHQRSPHPPFSTRLQAARTRVSLNGSLSSVFNLSRSVRQACPLAPLLFAIAADSLKDKIARGLIEGISLPGNNSQQCLSQFTDDNNADGSSLAEFWSIMDTLCKASGSKMNHNKTGIFFHQSLGCSVSRKEGFLGSSASTTLSVVTSMSFGVTVKARWD